MVSKLSAKKNEKSSSLMFTQTAVPFLLCSIRQFSDSRDWEYDTLHKKNVQHTLIVPKVIKVYIQQQQWFYLRPSLVLPFFFLPLYLVPL